MNDYKRDKELLNDVALILPYLEPGDTVIVEEELWNYFSLHAILYMDKRVNLSTDIKNSSYILKNKKDHGVGRVPLATQQLDLYLNR